MITERAIVNEQDWPVFTSNLAAFAWAAIPAALVNSGLKYMQVRIEFWSGFF